MTHRPRFVLFVAGRLPTVWCKCHGGLPVRWDRQLPRRRT